MEVQLGSALVVLTTALFLVVLIERVAEWAMPFIDWAVVGIVGQIRKALGYNNTGYIWEGPAKLLGISIFNGAFYAAFFGYDFVGPLIEGMTEASISGWRGLVLSTLLIAGGSNLIHQIFTKKEVVRIESDGVRINCP